MKVISRFFLVALITAMASGCVYVNGERVGTSNDWNDWEKAQERNREYISNLEMGVSTQSVLNELGTPADSEAFTDDDVEVRVLFYRTTRKHSDGDTTRDETTPLVFRDDQLIGWGEKVYQAQR